MPGSKGSYLWEKPIPLAFRLNFALPQYEKRDWNVISGLTNVPPAVADGATGESRTDVSDTALRIVNWQILSGGTLAPNVSYFFQVVGTIEGQDSDNFQFPGPEHEPGETEIETEAIVIQIDDILPNSLMNFRAGKAHIDNLFFSRPRRLTFASYLTMFQPLTGASLHANAIGVEVNGIHESSGIWYAVGMRNRGVRFNSSDLHEVRPGAYYGILNLPFSLEDEQQTLGLLVNANRVGNENFGTSQGAPSFNGTDAPTFGVGGVLDLHWGPFNLIPGFYYYTEGRAAHATIGTFEATSGTVELHYMVIPELILTGRWDFLNVIGQPAGTFEDDLDQFVANIAWYFHPNVRLVAEYSYLDAKLNRLTTLPFNNDLYVSVPGALGTQRADLKVTKLILGFEVNF
ncbi:MAG: hypothetical protein IID17_06150 [Nitrospinae bacterium]|nr:hypothetical protein [Nitrospinota bacterium]